MPTLTLSAIRSLVRSDLNESAETRLTDTELDSCANDGYKDVAVKGLCYELIIPKANIPASVGLVSMVGLDVILVNDVEYSVGGSGKGMMRILPQARGRNSYKGAAPQRWFSWGSFLAIEPLPDVGTYDLNIYADCYPSAKMTEDTDTPSDLPAEFHECVYLFTRAFAALKLRRWADAAAFYNEYIASVQKKKAEYIMKRAEERGMRKIPDIVGARNG